MLKKIVNLFKSNLVSVVLNAFLILLTAKFLGAEGRGEITIITSISLVLQLINGVVGSGAVYYLLRRFNVSELWAVSFLWFIVVSFLSSSLCLFLNFINEEYYFIIFAYTFLSSGLTLQLMLHIHLNQTAVYGRLKVLQPLIIIALMFFCKKELNTYIFFIIYIGVLLICVCGSFYYLKPRFSNLNLTRLFSLVRASIKYGGTSQLSNLTQMVNYRYSFFLLESYIGLAAVGVFSVVFSICEVIWLFCSTVSTVICSDISKYNDRNREITDTKKAYKLVFIVTAVLILIILLIPVEIYVLLLNEEFIKIKQVLYYMIPGVLVFAVAKVIAHYFSALGNMKLNLFSSAIGMIVLVPLGFVLIPEYGIIGAAITNSVSYLVTSFLLIFFFKQRTGSSLL